ncbi:MAG: hypothetical protein IJD80_07480 [Oscillospiraceae bacterium]|nr:hypothetical protein [Oscillospiraceae bacterium]
MDINLILKGRLTFHKRSFKNPLFENIPPLMKRAEYDEVLAFADRKAGGVYMTDPIYRMMNEVLCPAYFAHLLFTMRSGYTALITGTEKAVYPREYNSIPQTVMGKVIFADFGAAACHRNRVDFMKLMSETAKKTQSGSSVAFYYRDNSAMGIKELLAEEIFGYCEEKYNYGDMEKLLSDCGWRIYEHLDSMQAEEQFFERFNMINPKNQIKAQKNICCVLAVRR